MSLTLEQIKEALINDEMTHQDAADLIYQNKKKPWHTKEWQEKRDQLIKDACEQCGNTEGTMVLQHIWQPDKYRFHVRTVYDKYFEMIDRELTEKDISNNDVEEYLSKFTDERDTCPNCQKLSFYSRKTMQPKYKCSVCDHEFDEPRTCAYSTESGVAPSYEKAKLRILNGRKKSRTWEKYESEIKKQAVLKAIEEHQRYMSLEDTKTFCKKCAYLWDVKKKKPCEVCKENYVTIYMHACYDCQLEGHREPTDVDFMNDIRSRI